MPPKRKFAEVEERSSSSATKKTRSSDGKGRRKKSDVAVDGEYKEPIKYDEYMEAGIPDSLLAGLGFSEDLGSMERDASPVQEEEEEEEELQEEVNNEQESNDLMETRLEQREDRPLEDGEIPTIDSRILSQASSAASLIMSQLSAIAANQAAGLVRSGGGFNPKQYLKPAGTVKGRASVQPIQSTKTIKPIGSSSSNNGNRSMNVNTAPKNKELPQDAICSESSAPSRKSVGAAAGTTPTSVTRTNDKGRPYSVNPRIFRKGNIIYERMPTGEVIASLVKSGDDGVIGQGVVGKAPPMQSLAQSSQRQPVRVNPQQRLTSRNFNNNRSMTDLSAQSLSENCPIDEFNVNDMLERSVRATQSMKLLLASLRDDLRRIGIGNTNVLTQEQIRKCHEVKEKLSGAYATYKKSIDGLQPKSSSNQRIPLAPPSVTTPQRYGTVLGGGAGRGSMQREVGSSESVGMGVRTPQGRGGKQPGSSSSFWSGVRSANAAAEMAERDRMRELMLINAADVVNVEPLPPSVIVSPIAKSHPIVKSPVQSPMQAKGTWKGRGGRRRSSASRGRDVIEVSDSEEEELDDEEVLLNFAERPKDLASERRSRDQRAADRAALRSAALSETQPQETLKSMVAKEASATVGLDPSIESKCDPVIVSSDTSVVSKADDTSVISIATVITVASDTSIAEDRVDKTERGEADENFTTEAGRADTSGTMKEDNDAPCNDEMTFDSNDEERNKEDDNKVGEQEEGDECDDSSDS